MLVHEVEQNTPEWFALRAGMPTASAFSNLLTAKGGKPGAALHTYANKLASEKFSDFIPETFPGNYATRRGHELEPDAREYYAFTNEVEVFQIGFVTDDAETMGCSPDSLIGDDGLLEIKCLGPTKHIESLRYVDAGECPPDYRYQVQGQLMITGRQYCDLFFYDPVYPKVHIRILPDFKLNMALTTGVKAVIDERDEILEMLHRQAA